MKSFIAAIVVFIFGQAGAHAACNAGSMAGNWILAVSDGSFCELNIAKSGVIARGACVYRNINGPSSALTGTIKPTRGCTLRNSVRFGDGTTATVSGRVDAAGGLMNGTLLYANGNLLALTAHRY